jgi:cytochrome c biogenesis protein CcmG/thiol:disulfide interchange protein DsbE
MPETYVLNGKGEIVFKHVGPISPESMQTRLMPAIARAQAAAAQPAPAPTAN